jgi:hypothetical protein
MLEAAIRGESVDGVQLEQTREEAARLAYKLGWAILKVPLTSIRPDHALPTQDN